ncbi:integrin alpha-4-like isoform X1 [Tachypleus tridentatus]|uniref:integrin alpha-4-like isoform X1 n=2 Tax=Tachypleus tridentatus TaxID=6853 RepID=UPI003FD26863
MARAKILCIRHQLTAYLILLSWSGVLGFNVDTIFPIYFKGPSQGAYFGYNVALHKNRVGSLALITAPQANCSTRFREIYQPGVLYKCFVNSETCEEVELYKEGNTEFKNGEEFTYHDLKNGSWLGVSLAVQPGGENFIVTCGHLWKNQRYNNIYLTNGICYVIDRELNPSSVVKLTPFSRRSNQSIQKHKIYYHAFALGGFSAVYSEENYDFLLGAPGIYDWTGSVADFRTGKNTNDTSLVGIPMPPWNQDPSQQAYIGYSVTMGRFFEFGGELFVTGAPRDADNKGRVYMFDALSIINPVFDVKAKKEGEQMGEYFGAVVLGINLNNDRFTDLIVGAPLHSKESGGDEGKVYVYISDGVGLQNTEYKIMGSEKPNARFGSAIANAGDLNQDGYLDVAVGAPYEDTVGAVYIYHGTEKGLSPKFVQRIGVSDLDKRLRGFGISIGRGLDIDSNSYPDLLIGAYDSDQAVLLRSKPVVHVVSTIEFNTTQINTSVTNCHLGNKRFTCFEVKYCVQFTGKYIPQTLKFSFGLEIDTVRTENSLIRGYLLDKVRSVEYVNRTLDLISVNENCFSDIALMNANIQDFITPVQFRLSYQLAGRSKRQINFCKTCPILDVTEPNFVTKEIAFATGCGEDNTCQSDLKLYAQFVNFREEEILVIGENTSLTLNVEVYSSQEPAYQTVVEIMLPPDVGIINQANCYIYDKKDSNSSSGLTCNVGNPLGNGQKVKFQIKLDTSRITNDIEKLSFELVAKTSSTEMKSDDNHVVLTLPFKALADITITGFANTEQIIYKEQKQEKEEIAFTHSYIVLKYLPSPIKSADVTLSLPTSLNGIKFIKLQSVEVDEGRALQVPGSCNVSIIELEPRTTLPKSDKEVVVNVDGKNPEVAKDQKDSTSLAGRKKRAADDSKDKPVSKDYLKNLELSCVSASCTQVTCVVGPFTDNKQYAKLKIDALMNMKALEAIKGKRDTLTVVSEGEVKINDEKPDIQPNDHRPDQTKVVSTFVKAGPPPPAKLQNWIIAVSIGAGVLLLILILLACIHFGFFRRKKKEEMERMRQQAALLEWQPYLVTDEEVEREKEAYSNATTEGTDK